MLNENELNRVAGVVSCRGDGDGTRFPYPLQSDRQLVETLIRFGWTRGDANTWYNPLSHSSDCGNGLEWIGLNDVRVLLFTDPGQLIQTQGVRDSYHKGLTTSDLVHVFRFQFVKC